MANRKPTTHDLKAFPVTFKPGMSGHIGELHFIDTEARYTVGKYQVGDYVIIHAVSGKSSQYKITAVLIENLQIGEYKFSVAFSPRGSIPV